MSTMEHLFMQIFDRRRRIEDQFRDQVQSYGESLASNLLAEGRRPPPWLWTSGSDDPSRQEWNREQLISEILDPLPRVTTPANSSSLFILPTLKGKSVNLFNSNNVFTAMSNDESAYNDIPEGSRPNTEMMVEPEATAKNSMSRQPTRTNTSGPKHEKPDMPPSKKAKIVKYPVENTMHEFTGRVTRSMDPCLNHVYVKDGTVRKYHSVDQSSKLAKPQSNDLSACIDNHACVSSVDELSLHAVYTNGNGCLSTNSISSRFSAITLSVSAFGIENHERSSDVYKSKLDADAANILASPDYSHSRRLNDDIFHALEGTRSVEAMDMDPTEGPSKEMHQLDDPGCGSPLRCQDCQPLSTDNPVPDFKVNDFPGQLNELQDCSRESSLDRVQQHTAEEHCNSKMMELSEPFYDVFISNDKNSIDASVEGLNKNNLKASLVKLNSTLNDRLVPGHSKIAEGTSRHWKTMQEDVSDSGKTVLERKEIERVSNGCLEEGMELHVGNSECISQSASYCKNSSIFVNAFSNPPSNKDGPVNSSMDSSGHISDLSDCSRKKTFRNPVQCTMEEECCENPETVLIAGKSEGSYSVEEVHFPSRRIEECCSSEKLVSYSEVTNRVSDGDQTDIIGTEDSESNSYYPVCTVDALVPTIYSLKENASACSFPYTGNMLNYVDGLSVQPNLMQDNGEERLLEIPTQYSEGYNVMGEPEAETIASLLKQISTMHDHGPVSYSSEANDEVVGSEETINSAKQISHRSTVRSAVPPGTSNANDICTINDKITPDAKIMCNTVPKARYFLRSSTMPDKQYASLESSSRIDDSSNLRHEVDTCNITWPRRKHNGHSSNVLATSPRLRLKTLKHIEKQTDCMWREILNNTSGSSNDLQPFTFSCDTEDVLSEVAVGQFEEEHVSKKSRIMEADKDLKGKCQAVRTSPSSKHKLDLYLERSPVLQHVHDSLGRSEHRSPTKFGSFEGITGMEQMQAGEGIFKTSYLGRLPNQYDRDMDGLEETMPEFEGFISVPPVIEDEVICNDFEIPILSKETTSLLEQLSSSENILTAKSCPSLKFNIDKLPDVYHSLPAGILEKLDLSNYLRVPDIDLERFSTANDARTSDPFSCLGSEFDESLLRSHSSNAKYVWEACKLPITPPVDKLHQRTIIKKSTDSSEKRGSNPELVCFRIDENSSTTEESMSEQGVGYKGFQNSTNRVALADVTSVYQNVPTSISLGVKYLERGSLDSADTMPQMEIDLKENDNLSVSCSSVQSSNDFRSQLNKTDISGKANRRKGGRTVSGRWCKPSNIISNISSFIPLVRETQQIAAPAGKRDIKVKALEAAEAAKRLEEKKQYEREMRKAAAKLERVKLEHENVQRLELKQKQKEESRKKREADLKAQKRQREVERIEKERKKRCTQEARKHQRGDLERTCVDKGDKVPRDKNAKEKKRKGKELTKDANKQARLVKEQEVAANKNTAELVPSVSNVVSKYSGHVNSGVEAHGVLLNENDFSKMTNVSYASQTAIEDRMSVATENRDIQSYEISPYKESDDEDGDEDHVRRTKSIPAWARRESLQQIVLSRRHLDPTDVFARKRSFDLSKVLSPRVPRRLPP